MKLWLKILIVCVGGALVWGLSYCSSIWTDLAFALSSFAAGVTALVGALTGFKPAE